MRLEALIPLALLAACNTAIGTEVSRSAAKSVVNSVVSERFPGAPLEPTTDCIIDNASGDEIVTLATSAATRDDQTATRLVLDIVQRPDTVQCVLSNGLPALINTL